MTTLFDFAENDPEDPETKVFYFDVPETTQTTFEQFEEN